MKRDEMQEVFDLIPELKQPVFQKEIESIKKEFLEKCPSGARQ